MSYYVVTRDAGPAWVDGKGAFEQPGVDEHVVFMNALADQGIVLVAGPLAGSEHERIHVLLIVNADSEADIHDRLAADPWAQAQRLVTTSVDPWNIFVGADRLTAAQIAETETAADKVRERSRFITLSHAATKARTNFSRQSSWA
jgi:uncharacterized protein YciI